MTFNSSGSLEQFWRNGIPKEVEWVVVDNASSDGSAELAQELGASKVVRLPKNLGFSRACNIGLNHCVGEYIGFVNPDVSVNFSTLPLIAAALEREESLVAPQLCYPDGTLQPNGRGMPSLWNKVVNRLAPPQHENEYYRFAEPGEEKYVIWLIGAAVCARRETLMRLGGWDERFFVYYEDSDLGLRAWNSGIHVKLIGSARWIHGWRRETKGAKVGPWKRELRSMAKFYRLYPKLLISKSPPRP